MERLVIFDAALSRRFTLSQNSTWRQMAGLMAHLGDGLYVFGGLGLLHLAGRLGGDSLLRRNTVIIVLIVITTMLAVTFIKFLVRRQRPQPPGEFVTLQYDLYSFPSGHAARLAALAVSAAYFYPPAAWLLAGVALSVAAARVAVGIHYVSDIAAGLTVGALVARTAITLLSLLPIPIS